MKAFVSRKECILARYEFGARYKRFWCTIQMFSVRETNSNQSQVAFLIDLNWSSCLRNRRFTVCNNVWKAIWVFIQHFPISGIISRYREFEFPILGNQFPISGNNQFPDIEKSFADIGKSFLDIGKWDSFLDIGKYFLIYREIEFPISENNSIFPDIRNSNSRYREIIYRYRELFLDIGNSNSRYREIISDIGKWWIKTQMAFHNNAGKLWSEGFTCPTSYPKYTKRLECSRYQVIR